jgi:hypothetical protein
LRLELADDTVLVDAVFCVTEDRDGDRRETREEDDHQPAAPEAGWR